MEIKNKFYQLRKNNQGSVELLMSMIVLTAILTVVLTASEIIRNGLVSDKTQLDSAKAYFAAEAGAERSLWDIRNNSYSLDSGYSGDCLIFPSANEISGSFSYDNCADSDTWQNLTTSAKYQVKYNTGTETKLTSYGDYQGARRAVEIIY